MRRTLFYVVCPDLVIRRGLLPERVVAESLAVTFDAESHDDQWEVDPPCPGGPAHQVVEKEVEVEEEGVA